MKVFTLIIFLFGKLKTTAQENLKCAECNIFPQPEFEVNYVVEGSKQKQGKTGKSAENKLFPRTESNLW